MFFNYLENKGIEYELLKNKIIINTKPNKIIISKDYGDVYTCSVSGEGVNFLFGGEYIDYEMTSYGTMEILFKINTKIGVTVSARLEI